MFTNQHVNKHSQNKHLKMIKTQKYSWGSYTATGSESTEREQTPYSTHLIKVYFLHDYTISPTRHREIVELYLHPEIDTKWFIEAKNQMQRVFKKENPNTRAFANKNILRVNWSMGPIDSGTKGTHVHHV